MNGPLKRNRTLGPMSDRAPVGPLDGIVVVELSLDERDEVETVVGFLRAGAAALEQMPVARTNAGEQLARRRACDVGERIADEIEAEARRVHDARQAFYRQQGKGRR